MKSPARRKPSTAPELFVQLDEARKSLNTAIQCLEIVPGRENQLLGIQLILSRLLLWETPEKGRQPIREQMLERFVQIEIEAASHLGKAMVHLNGAAAACGKRDLMKAYLRVTDAVEAIQRRLGAKEADPKISEPERLALRYFAAQILGGGFPPEKAAALEKARAARARNRRAKPNQLPRP